MMTMTPAQQRAADARALTIALALAAKARWQLERAGPVLPAPFDAYFYVASADLLVLPTGLTLDEACRAAYGGTRQARADALIVSCADRVPEFAIAMWSSASTRWHLPVCLWMSDGGLLWTCELDGQAETGLANTSVTFPIRPGRLMATGIVPWLTTGERLSGQLRAAAWLGKIG